MGRVAIGVLDVTTTVLALGLQGVNLVLLFLPRASARQRYELLPAWMLIPAVAIVIWAADQRYEGHGAQRLLGFEVVLLVAQLTAWVRWRRGQSGRVDREASTSL